jgi:GH25 family lysozyme M1 (1,4-beta-N-acetylmuramidase)
MVLLGTDLSDHNGVPDFAQLAADGIAFAVIKVTGGDQYVNPLWQQQYAGARAAGLVVGLYHYDAEPTVHTGSAAAEAAWFVQHLPDPLPPDVFLALDAEEQATRDPVRYRAFLDAVGQATGKRVLFYTYPNFILGRPTEAQVNWALVADAPLWYAFYPGDVTAIVTQPMPVAPPPFDKRPPTIWQYSGRMGLVSEAGTFDMDRFDGALDDLKALGAPVTAQTQPNDNPGFPLAIQPDGRTVINGVDFGGEAICCEVLTVQVRNAAGERYTRRWVGYTLEPWVKIP